MKQVVVSLDLWLYLLSTLVGCWTVQIMRS
ncbi:hypothetical protein [Actinomycetia phage DSL-LC01]|nr:hypothetical protein [Actinomycetia phage DSL-LC01]